MYLHTMACVFRLDIRKHFFTKGMVKHWNRHAREVIDAAVFKGYFNNALTFG